MRAMLVIEMPESCLECPCGNECGDECRAEDRQVETYENNYIDGQYDRPDWCPLVPMLDERKDKDHGKGKKNGTGMEGKQPVYWRQ